MTHTEERWLAGLEKLGVDRVRLAIRAFDHQPRNKFCGCFLGEAFGAQWHENWATCPDREQIQKAHHALHGDYEIASLSGGYEHYTPVFKNFVLDWLAQHDARNEPMPREESDTLMRALHAPQPERVKA